MAVRVLLPCFLFLISTPALAQEAAPVRVEVDGSADSGPDNARISALDDGFQTAVKRVAASLASANQLDANRPDVKKHVYRRARRFIASYTLLSEKRGGGLVRVKIAALVKQGALLAALKKYGARANAPPPVSPTGTRPSVAVIAVQRGAGQGMPSPAAEKALRERVEGEGFRVLARSGLLVEDLSAGAIADKIRSLGAGGAFVLDIGTPKTSAIRATSLIGCTAQARLRVVDAAGQVVTETTKTVHGYGQDAQAAQASCGQRSAQRTIAKPLSAAAAHWPATSRKSGQVTIAISGARSNRSIDAIARALTSTRASITIETRIYRRGRVEFLVKSALNAGRLAAVVRSAKLPAGSLSASARGEASVRVRVRDYSTGGS